MSTVVVHRPAEGQAEEYWRVGCSEHDLDRTVDSERHALNIEAKHLREEHAGVGVDLEVDLSSTATVVAMAYSIIEHTTKGSDSAAAIVALWEVLTGLTGDGARELVTQVQASRVPVRAAVVPF